MNLKKNNGQKRIMPNYKPEIDSLRAIAVFLVIFFHFELLHITGGFVGVDVFFVISGYLITNLILIDLKNKKFSIFEFYIRRIRRIIPALYATIIISLFFGYLILSPIHLGRFGESSTSSALGISNFYFWYEAGYFDYSKLFKPLLHTWTLSVELQFYLFWPILIFLIYKFSKKNLKIVVLSIILFCLFFSIIYSERATGYFYFTGFRLYEFAIGSFTYIVKENLKTKFNDALLVVGILFLIIVSLTFNEDNIFPGYNALIPCLTTSLILLVSGNLKYFKSLFINSFLIYLGKISYSLYLIHWPLLVFYQYIVIQPLTYFEKIALIFITLLLSVFSYRYIELPFRKRKNKKFLILNKNLLVYFLSSFFIILFISQLFVTNNGFESKLNPEKSKILNRLKSENEKASRSIADTQNIESKTVPFKNNKSLIKTLVMGDSHAGNIYWSLINNNKFSSALDVKLHGAIWPYCFKNETSKDRIAIYIKQNIFKNFKIKKMCKKEEKNFKLNNLLRSADVIILSSRWNDKLDLKKIINYLKKKVFCKNYYDGQNSRIC